MSEKYSIHSITEEEPALSDLELIADQMRDITFVPEFGLNLKDDETPEARCKRLSDWAKNANFDYALNKAGYFEDEDDWTDDSKKLLKLGFMTPYHTGTQGKKVPARELVEYNEALREAIKANSGLKASDLATFLQGTTMWARLPEAHRKTTEKEISSRINGARAEVFFGEILKSNTIKAAGITCKETSLEDDVWGGDFCVSVPFTKGDERVVVEMFVDVKSTSQQVASIIMQSQESKEPKPYAIKGDAIVLWSGVDLREVNDSLSLDRDTVEKKAKPMVKVLRVAAADYYRMVQGGYIRDNLGKLATKAA